MIVGNEISHRPIDKKVTDCDQAGAKGQSNEAFLEQSLETNRVVGIDEGTPLLDAMTFEYVDMAKAGIIDPAKVERCALQNAASVAAMFLTTEALVVDVPEEKK